MAIATATTFAGFRANNCVTDGYFLMVRTRPPQNCERSDDQ
jgi:hypothetical protein